LFKLALATAAPDTWLQVSLDVRWQLMPPNRQLILIFMICAIAFGCATTRESTVRKYCKYIRPDMTLADANELIGWEAEVVDGSWYWTDKKRCIVQMNEGKIVSVSDFVRFKI
jgi:hypothetical protein